VQNYDSQVAQSHYAYGQTERHFGLGNRTNEDVEVTFYSTGRVTRINNVVANQTIQVQESAGSVPLMAATRSTDLVFASLSTPLHQSTANSQPQSQILASTDRAQPMNASATSPNHPAAAIQATLAKPIGPLPYRYYGICAVWGISAGEQIAGRSAWPCANHQRPR